MLIFDMISLGSYFCQTRHLRFMIISSHYNAPICNMCHAIISINYVSEEYPQYQVTCLNINISCKVKYCKTNYKYFIIKQTYCYPHKNFVIRSRLYIIIINKTIKYRDLKDLIFIFIKCTFILYLYYYLLNIKP